MLQGSTKPHRVTRLVVWVASLTGLIAVLNSSSSTGKLFAVIFFIRATYLLGMSLKYGVGGRSRRDILCLALSLIGIVLAFASYGLIGVMFAVLADIIGYVPAYIKTYKDPSSEEPYFYILEALAATVALIGIGKFKVDVIMPVYFVVSNITMLGFIRRKKS